MVHDLTNSSSNDNKNHDHNHNNQNESKDLSRLSLDELIARGLVPCISCGVCKEDKMSRCSRCRKAVYCSARYICLMEFNVSL